MQINTKHYQYSYADYIGNILKAPLFKLTANLLVAASPKPWESTAKTVSKIAFRALVLLSFIIPALISWSVGKIFTVFSSTRIDYDGLSLAPPPYEIIEMPQDQNVDIFLLCRDFSKIYPDQPNKAASLRRLCDAAVNNSNHSDKQLLCLLKAIVGKIERGEVSANKKKDLLAELAEAATRCPPTWLEVAEKIYREVDNRPETVEIKLLRCIQEVKETVILEFSQNEADFQWHALNYVRNMLGQELGLGDSKNDPHAGEADLVFSKNIVKWLFLERYSSANRVIMATQSMINLGGYDPCYHDFLVQIVKEQNIQNPEDFVATHFFGDDYKINFAGVNLILRSIGVLR